MMAAIIEGASRVVNEGLEKRYGRPVIYNDRAVCGKKGRGGRSSGVVGEKFCTHQAGWGTSHFGYGPCKYHDESMSTSLAPLDPNSYTAVITHPRLRELVEEEEARQDLDNIDMEIALTRAALKLTTEQLGLVVNDDGTGVEMTTNPAKIRRDASEIAQLAANIPKLIEMKYRVLHLGRAVLPREQVRAYVTQIQLILDRTLHDTCPNCGTRHNLRELTLKALSMVPDL